MAKVVHWRDTEMLSENLALLEITLPLKNELIGLPTPNRMNATPSPATVSKPGLVWLSVVSPGEPPSLLLMTWGLLGKGVLGCDYALWRES